MADAQTAFELRRAFKKPGCPVCTLAQHVSARYVDSLFYESILDPAPRDRLRASLGLCYEHAWLTIDAKLSDALGLAIVYNDLIGHLLGRLPDKAQTGARGRQALTDSLTPERPCPACQSRDEVEKRAIEVLAGALQEPDFLEDYLNGGGLCLPHYRALLGQNLNQKALQRVDDHQRSHLESLKGELAEFIRKNDYRFQDEEMGSERDSYQRAAEFVTGKRRPERKKDLNW